MVAALLVPLWLAAMLAATAGPGRESATGPHAVIAASSIEATPVSGGCNVQPRTFAEIQAIRAFVEEHPPEARLPWSTPAAVPASRETIDFVRSVVEEWIACSAAGEPLRVWALYTDDYLGRLLYRQRGFDRALYDAFATPRPAAPGDATEVRSITDVQTIEDGLTRATVVLFYPGLDMEKRFVVVLVEVAERWLIDDIVGEIGFSVP